MEKPSATGDTNTSTVTARSAAKQRWRQKRVKLGFLVHFRTLRVYYECFALWRAWRKATHASPSVSLMISKALYNMRRQLKRELKLLGIDHKEIIAQDWARRRREEALPIQEVFKGPPNRDYDCDDFRTA